MSPFEQLVRLLSEPAGSIAYHLLTLFAVQATVAIAWWQWRRMRLAGRPDYFARRLLIAGSGLLLMRLAVLLIALYLSSRGDAASSLPVLPLLELAMNAFSLVLIVWALLRSPPAVPRLTDVLAILFSLLIAILFISFYWSWQQRAGIALSSGSGQAIIWNMLQLSIAGGGILWLLATAGMVHPLRLILLAALFLAYLLQLWSFVSQQDGAAPDWVRLGYLVALPLLAVIAYRHVLGSLLDETLAPVRTPPASDGALALAMKLLEARGPAAVAAAAVPLVLRETRADAAAVALLGLDPDAELTVFSGRRGAEQPIRIGGWSLERWPIFQQIVEQRRQFELRNAGADAGQLAEIAATLGLRDPAELIVAPIDQGRLILGVILIGYQAAGVAPSADWQRRLDLCRRLIVRAVVRVPPTSSAGPSAAASSQFANLVQERDNALAEAATLRTRLQQVETRPPIDERREDEVVDNTVNAGPDRQMQEQMGRLQREVTALRDALGRGETPATTVTPADGGSNAGWMVETIDRYSGQLEAAWARVHELEQAAAPSADSELVEPVAALARGLRTPMTAVYGWASLLAESDASPEKAILAQRLTNDVERMERSVRQLIGLAGVPAGSRVDGSVNTVEEIDAAIERVLSHVQEKRLLLQLEIAPLLPPAALPQHDLREMLSHLLDYACLVTPDGGRVALSAHADALESSDQWPAREKEHFLHLEVRNGGKDIRPADVTRWLESQDDLSAAGPQGSGMMPAGIVAANKVICAAGGRLWAAGDNASGGVFSVLLPVYQPATAAAPAQWTGR